MSQLQQALQPLITRITAGIQAQLSTQELIQSFIPDFTALLRTDTWLPTAFRQPNPERYQQFLLYRDIENRFSIVSFVWDKGQTTPIHNHEVWGVVGVLQGEEISQRYQRNAQGQ
ncbi:MAG: cysteine dioxygenase, partial [Acinetobacter sp.]